MTLAQLKEMADLLLTGAGPDSAPNLCVFHHLSQQIPGAPPLTAAGLSLAPWGLWRGRAVHGVWLCWQGVREMGRGSMAVYLRGLKAQKVLYVTVV